MKPFNPEPNPGLSFSNFRKISENGFGDRNNSYAYSMVWFKDHLYVGTGRATLCFLKPHVPLNVNVWPVECPYTVYSKEFEYTQARGEIWRYSPGTAHWERIYQSPMVTDSQGARFSRDFGYRAMTVFQGKSDSEPALYVATCARSRSSGTIILRSEDGINFFPISKPGLIGLPITSLRSLFPFKGKLYTTPAGATRGNQNTAGFPIIYETSDPVQEEWQAVNEPGFGDFDNKTIYELIDFGNYLYVGTFNNNGFQIWRTDAQGEPPYHWTKVITRGANRGSLNQGTVSMLVFKDALYVGTGIQNGGYDHRNKIGPAGAEIIRIAHDGSWEIIVGDERDGQFPLSGLPAGFGSISNGYIWRMGVHDGWLYAGTMNWSIILRFNRLKSQSQKLNWLLEQVGIENLIKNQGGFDLWRSFDGENWLPVSRQGFGNSYNYGLRNIVSTPYGLFIGTANPFGPRAAVQVNEQWTYEDNPNGGLEIWQSS